MALSYFNMYLNAGYTMKAVVKHIFQGIWFQYLLMSCFHSSLP